ncbi:hypothetical protein TEA_026143 [Camellia sinensis var. sinensis]|uniref:Peroxin-3 n=1 Tax=Camellia sinensis var. sinensis TaxID=542762 RepID=A0A4S4ECH9_CAMSN|nr:hypothetical protein TEA_026143 [Camellia sinensis var. sinensis]
MWLVHSLSFYFGSKLSSPVYLCFLHNIMLEFWRRHRRKVYLTLGALGSGYLLYKLYDAHRRRLSDLERELAGERENDELIKAQMQAHFENIQRISDTTTLPHSMLDLSSRVAEELDLLHLTERLIRGKGQPNTLTSSEKLELWERLKILNERDREGNYQLPPQKVVLNRVVVVGYCDGHEVSEYVQLCVRVEMDVRLSRERGVIGRVVMPLEEADLIDRNDQQQFLASADFLSNYGLPTLISNMQAAASEVLKGKQLKDLFNTTVLHETITQILDVFMSMRSPHHWVDYLMPEDARSYKLVAFSNNGNPDLSDGTTFDQLMVETHAVLSSAEFGNVVDISLKTVVDELMEDIKVQLGEGNLSSGMPLAKLLPRIAQFSPLLLEEPSKNRFIQIIRNIAEVELFFTLLYANMPTS